MSNINERLAKYSVDELKGLSKQADKQINRLTHEMLINVGSYQPVVGAMLEALTGHAMEKFGRATVEDFERVSIARNAMHRIEVLYSVVDKIRLQIRRNASMGAKNEQR